MRGARGESAAPAAPFTLHRKSINSGSAPNTPSAAWWDPELRSSLSLAIPRFRISQDVLRLSGWAPRRSVASAVTSPLPAPRSPGSPSKRRCGRAANPKLRREEHREGCGTDAFEIGPVFLSEDLSGWPSCHSGAWRPEGEPGRVHSHAAHSEPGAGFGQLQCGAAARSGAPRGSASAREASPGSPLPLSQLGASSSVRVSRCFC